MKALTLTQPWATLVMLGLKAYETRGWSTTHRGELVIHAAKGFPGEAQAFRDWILAESADFVPVPYRSALRDLPLGQVLGVVRLVTVRPTSEVRPKLLYGGRFAELEFGDFDDGRYAWLLERPRAFDKPVPMRGALGLWDVPDNMALGLASADRLEAVG